MLLQWLDASAPRFARAAARLPKALDPDNCGAGTNRKFLRRLAPRSSTFYLRNHSLPHLPRIGLWHRPASQKRINADSLSHPRPHENPPDSIGAEHALEGVTLNPCRVGLPLIQLGVLISNRHLDLLQTLFVEDFV